MKPLILATAFLALTACGGSPAPAVTVTAAATPSVRALDKWAVKTCTYLAEQDPANQFSHSVAATFAGMSSEPDLVELGARVKVTDNSNVLRGWCVRNYPQAGVKVAEPR